MEAKFKVTKKLTTMGTSRYVLIPADFLDHIGIKPEDDDISLMPDVNKKGQPYIALFKNSE